MARHECLISLFVAVPSSSFSTTNPGEEAVVSQPHLSSVFLYMYFTGIGQIDCLWLKHARSNSFQSR